MKSAAPVKPDLIPGSKAMANRVTEILEESIRNGTHSRTTRTVCEVCREWCSGIFYIGFTGTRMCAKCADLIGEGPESIDRRRREGR